MKREIKLDTASFKALSSDTRRKMIERLGKRRMTVTELAKSLDVSKSTAHEHLSRLSKAELVEKVDDDHKWVYYQLTDRGSELLNPNTRTRILLFTTALIATAGASFYEFYRSFSPLQPASGGRQMTTLEAGKDVGQAAEKGIMQGLAPESLLIGILLALVAIYFLFQLKRSWE